MATVIFANFMAYYLLFYALYSYDIIDHIDIDFYKKNEFSKFKFHPYGDLVDECNKNKEKTDVKALFNYIGLNLPKSFWLKNMELLSNLPKSRLNETFSDFDDLNKKINAIKINDFIYYDSEEEKNNIAWDIENDEQVNYYLFEMKNYTQMKPTGNNILKKIL